MPEVAERNPSLVRTIGRWSLTALMVNSIIGAGIFGLPSQVAKHLGGYSPFAGLLAGAGIVVIAACIAEVSSRYEETGGVYLYAREAFGRFTGILIAWLTWLTRIAAPAAAANLFVTYAAQFYPPLLNPWARLCVLGILIGHLAIVNYMGVRQGNTVSNLFTAVKVSFLSLFVAGGLLALTLRPELRVAPGYPPAATGDWLHAILLMVYAYGGFEGALFIGGEARDPRRDTPFALLLALAVVAAIYTAVQYVVVYTLPGATDSTRPLADSARVFLGPAGAAAMAIAALVSTYGYLSANILHAPRITYALGQQGDFPRFLAAVHPRYRTPHVSIWVYAALLFAFSALGNFTWNAVLSAVARLFVYGAMALAVVWLQKQRAAPEARFRLPVPYLFAASGVAFAVIVVAQMGRSEFLVVSGTLVVATLNWLLVRRRQPREINRV
jgi:basic amino acid/polyamine antiporter, APA family